MMLMMMKTRCHLSRRRAFSVSGSAVLTHSLLWCARPYVCRPGHPSHLLFSPCVLLLLLLLCVYGIFISTLNIKRRRRRRRNANENPRGKARQSSARALFGLINHAPVACLLSRWRRSLSGSRFFLSFFASIMINERVILFCVVFLLLFLLPLLLLESGIGIVTATARWTLKGPLTLCVR